MKQRVITGAVLTIFMIAVFVMSGTVVYPVIMTLLTVVGAWEMLGCTGKKNNPYLSVPAVILSLVCPIAAYFIGFEIMLAASVAYMTVLLAFGVFFDEKVKLSETSEVFLTTLYVVLCFTALLRLRYVENGGEYIYLLVFVAAWITDTFAYFTGFFFGKHKLIPRISPKKTVEGAVGGVIFCVAAFAVYGLVVSKITGLSANFAVLCAIGLFMSVLSQIGDLVASSVKRTYGIKDYGNLFPGHGGVLDRFDSIMILSPFLLAIVENVSIFS